MHTFAVFRPYPQLEFVYAMAYHLIKRIAGIFNRGVIRIYDNRLIIKCNNTNSIGTGTKGFSKHLLALSQRSIRPLAFGNIMEKNKDLPLLDITLIRSD